MIKSAVISSDGVYRYLLTRTWDASLPLCCWIMLNPSTADATVDDPTIRRCIAFTRAWGLGGIRVVNLYALRATDPRELRKVADPIGPDNDQAIIDACAGEWTVCAWGGHASPERAMAVRKLIASNALDVECLGRTASGQPRHPLYLAADTKREPYFLTRTEPAS